MAGFIVILVIGFWIPYFSAFPRFDTQITPATHIHAAALFGWVVLMLVQPVAVQQRALRLHRSLGWASLGVMAIVMVTSAMMLRNEYLGHLKTGADTAQALRSEYLSTAQLVLLLMAYVLSFRAAVRRDIDTHWRLIVCIVFLLLPAGLSRAFGYWLEFPQVSAQSACVVVNLAAAAILIVRDVRRHRRTSVFVKALACYVPVAAGWLVLGRPI